MDFEQVEMAMTDVGRTGVSKGLEGIHTRGEKPFCLPVIRWIVFLP